MYPNVYEKMIDIYPKITKYQVVVHDNKNLCVISPVKIAATANVT